MRGWANALQHRPGSNLVLSKHSMPEALVSFCYGWLSVLEGLCGQKTGAFDAVCVYS